MTAPGPGGGLRLGSARHRPILAVSLCAAILACQRAPPPRPSSPARTLQVLVGAQVRSLDPQTEWDDTTAIVFANVFEGLVRFDRNMRLTAGLALRWINPDEHTWRFALDPRARFHDGSPLQATDVVQSIESVRQLPGTELQALARHLTRTVAVDALTVEIRTDEPIAILNSLAYIPILKGGLGARGDELPLGTGPYRVAFWERGRRVRLEASPYHPAPPEIRAVELQFHDTPPEAAVVEQAHADLAMSLRLRVLGELSARPLPGLRVVTSGGLAVFYLMLNVRPHVEGGPTPNPLADVRVRRALELASDRAEIAREGLYGFGQPAWQMVVPQVFGYDPGVAQPQADPEAARRLLAAAGQAGLRITLHTETTGPTWLEQLLIRQWSRAGVQGSLTQSDGDVFRVSLAAGAFQAAVQGYSCGSGDAAELLDFGLHSYDARTGYGSGNFTGYARPEVDQLTDQNLRVFDPKQRLVLLQRALRLVSEDRPYVPLYSVESAYIVSNDLEWAPPVNDEVRFSDMKLRR